MNATIPANFRWGERTYFLDKRLSYVFSLDLHLCMPLQSAGPVGKKLRLRIEGLDDGEENTSSTYHVLDDDLVTCSDGSAHEVLLARAVQVDDWILLGPDSIGDLDGRLLLESHDGAKIDVHYTGVMKLAGPAAELANPRRGEKKMEGTAFIATRYETSSPKYRWLTQGQLIGFGRVKAGPVVESASRLDFKFDLYSAG
jgi:hypothetical protein